MNAETKKQILAIARDLGYQPNQVARSLRLEHSKTIGIIADDISTPFTPTIIRGVQDYLKQKGYFNLITNTDWDPQAEVSAVHDLMSRAVDGIIFVQTWNQGANEILDLANKPYVFIHRLFGQSISNSVIPDEEYGARLATRHLINLGHRRIAHISGPDHYYTSSERLTAYQAELQSHGIADDPGLVVKGNWEVESGYDAGKVLLQRTPAPTAIFAANDLMALGAIYAAQEAGLRVPEDLAVVGYDNRNFAGFVQPAITTVTLPVYEMGQRGAQLLLEHLGGEPDLLVEVKVRGELIIRASCGSKEIPADSRLAQRGRSFDREVFNT
jgi:LacI family transcriptional regulator